MKYQIIYIYIYILLWCPNTLKHVKTCRNCLQAKDSVQITTSQLWSKINPWLCRPAGDRHLQHRIHIVSTRCNTQPAKVRAWSNYFLLIASYIYIYCTYIHVGKIEKIANLKYGYIWIIPRINHDSREVAVRSILQQLAQICTCTYILYLVGGFNPSEKYESQMGWWFPNMGK